jgi:hypothetical protein
MRQSPVLSEDSTLRHQDLRFVPTEVCTRPTIMDAGASPSFVYPGRGEEDDSALGPGESTCAAPLPQLLRRAYGQKTLPTYLSFCAMMGTRWVGTLRRSVSER